MLCSSCSAVQALTSRTPSLSTMTATPAKPITQSLAEVIPSTTSLLGQCCDSEKLLPVFGVGLICVSLPKIIKYATIGTLAVGVPALLYWFSPTVGYFINALPKRFLAGFRKANADYPSSPLSLQQENTESGQNLNVVDPRVS